MNHMKSVAVTLFLAFNFACGVDSSVTMTEAEFESSQSVGQALEGDRRPCCCKSTIQTADGQWSNHVMCGYWNYDVLYSSQSEAENKCRENNARNGCASVD